MRRTITLLFLLSLAAWALNLYPGRFDVDPGLEGADLGAYAAFVARELGRSQDGHWAVRYRNGDQTRNWTYDKVGKFVVIERPDGPYEYRWAEEVVQEWTLLAKGDFLTEHKPISTPSGSVSGTFQGKTMRQYAFAYYSRETEKMRLLLVPTPPEADDLELFFRGLHAHCPSLFRAKTPAVLTLHLGHVRPGQQKIALNVLDVATDEGGRRVVLNPLKGEQGTVDLHLPALHGLAPFKFKAKAHLPQSDAGPLASTCPATVNSSCCLSSRRSPALRAGTQAKADRPIKARLGEPFGIGRAEVTQRQRGRPRPRTEVTRAGQPESQANWPSRWGGVSSLP